MSSCLLIYGRPTFLCVILEGIKKPIDICNTDKFWAKKKGNINDITLFVQVSLKSQRK